MAKLEIQIDDEVLTEAEKVLFSLGMDVEMAVSIYLRRIAIENGLPLSMAAVPKRVELETTEEIDGTLDDDLKPFTRSNNKITPEMVEEVWRSFLIYLEGSSEINWLSNEVNKKTNMSRGSAFIYLNILANLVKGEPNTRTMKMKDLEYYMKKIKVELGEKKYQYALRSLKQSIPYWREKVAGNFAEKVEAYCKKNS